MIRRFTVIFCALVPWFVALCGVAGLLAESWLLGFLAAAAIILLFGFLLRRRGLQQSPFYLPLLFILLLCTISIRFVTSLPVLSAPYAARLLLGVLLCLAFSEFIPSRRALSWLVGAILGAILALSLVAPFMISWTDKFAFWPILSKEIPNVALILRDSLNPNIAGGVFSALLIAVLAALLFSKGLLTLPGNFLLIVLISILAIDLALTQARAALLVAVLVLLMLVALRWKWGWLFAALVLAAGTDLVLNLGPTFVWHSLVGSTGGSQTFILREEIWQRALLLIADFPLSGVGIGTFSIVVAMFYPLGFTPDHAHNLFLQLAADLGLPGLLAWLGCFITILILAWRLFRSPDPLFRALGAAALGFNAVLFLHGLLDCVFWDTRPALIVWAVWGLVLAAERLSHPEEDLKSA